GAIIVTFLFVIMLAQQAGLSDADSRSREPLLSCIAGFVLLGAILFVLHRAFLGETNVLNAPPLEPADFTSLVERMDEAGQKKTVAEIAEVLGDEEGQFFNEFRRKLQGARSTPATRNLAGRLREVESRWWNVWKPAGQADSMKSALGLLRLEVRRAVDERGQA